MDVVGSDGKLSIDDPRLGRYRPTARNPAGEIRHITLEAAIDDA